MSKALLGKAQVGPYMFEILLEPNLIGKAGARGQFFPEDGRILIHKGLSPTVQQETISHEIEHALYYAAGLYKRKSIPEEESIAALSPLRLATYQNNPYLRELLGL